VVGRHLFASAAVQDGDFARAQAHGSTSGVDSGVAAAYDDNVPAEAGLLAERVFAQKVNAVNDATRVFARDIEFPAFVGAGGDEDGIVHFGNVAA